MRGNFFRRDCNEERAGVDEDYSRASFYPEIFKPVLAGLAAAFEVKVAVWLELYFDTDNADKKRFGENGHQGEDERRRS